MLAASCGFRFFQRESLECCFFGRLFIALRSTSPSMRNATVLLARSDAVYV
jgi:hypothetical protein